MSALALAPIGAPTSASKALWLILALPLAGAAINLLVGKRIGKLAGSLATTLVAVAFVLSIAAVRDLLAVDAGSRLYVLHLFEWIHVGSFSVGADLRLDALSAVMILVVTGIGSLIHLYAIGYMHGDPRYGRFFAYMNLFVFFMLLLVLGQNLLLLYVGWEGVGLCSYLLIGFWFEKTENANAAKKAFVTTRIGDTAMMIGLALLVVRFGTLDFTTIFGSAGGTLTKGTATTIALLLFAGAVGKSAQVPLHVWLPDAMAGPTPVSALIHAATMVTAGVYLVLRMHVIFEISGVALTVVAVTGLVTMLFAGTCAFGQDDIKRVLAYSTISQLGYMFLAAGMRAYSIALFMLVTHAFYKALMFLGAGSVMHGMHEETDMKRMGGLIRRMPVTGVTFIVGALALSGVFPLSGFFAKDEILEVANATGRPWFYVLGSAGALLSALYMGRLVFLTFFGRARSEEAEGAHESSPVMTVPLVVLAVGAAVAGLLDTSTDGLISRFVEPVVGLVPEGAAGITRSALVAISLLLAIGGLLITWVVYASGKIDWLALRVRMQPAQRVLEHGWYVDNYYSALLVTPGKAAAAWLAYVFDTRILDGFVNGIGASARALARSGRRLQTGLVRTYALAFLAGAIGLLVYVGFRL
ncbi:MAG: NADH-quinone oxidoreductase subunit L [Actinomycetota bacterium]